MTTVPYKRHRYHVPDFPELGVCLATSEVDAAYILAERYGKLHSRVTMPGRYSFAMVTKGPTKWSKGPWWWLVPQYSDGSSLSRLVRIERR